MTSGTCRWSLIGYLGLVTMAVAYALLFTGLRSTPSGSAVVATLLEPVTAVSSPSCSWANDCHPPGSSVRS